jgi:hypothetical protein
LPPAVISAGNGMPSTVTVSVSEPTAHVTTTLNRSSIHWYETQTCRVYRMV